MKVGKMVEVFAVGLVLSAWCANVHADSAGAGDDIFSFVQGSIDPAALRPIDRGGSDEDAGLSDDDDDLPYGFKINTNEGLKDFEPGPVDSTINFKGPVGGVEAILENSADLSKVLNDQLTSPLAVQEITWHLTEPGVAAGMASAASHALQVSNGRVLAEDNFYKQLEYMGESRDVLIRAYQQCMRAYGIIGDRTGWAEAQRQCMRDVSKNASGVSGMDFDQVVREPGIWPEGGGYTKVYLTQFLFGPDVAPMTAGAAGSIPPAWAAKLVKQFRAYFGDIAIELDPEDLRKDLASLSFRQIRTKREPPSSPDGKPTGGLRELALTRRKEVYNGIFEILKKYCEWHVNFNPESCRGAADGVECQRRNTFFGNPDNFIEADVRKVSTLRSVIGETEVIVLYRLLVGPQTDPRDCSFLDSTAAASPYNYEKLIGGEGGASPDPSKAGRFIENQKLIYRLASRIAKGQIVDSVVALDTFIQGMTLGSVSDGYFKNQARQLMQQALGGENLAVLQARSEAAIGEAARAMIAQIRKGASGGGMFVMQREGSAGSGNVFSTTGAGGGAN